MDNDFNDTYSYYGSTQLTNLDIEKGEKLNFNLDFENDVDRTYRYVMKASGADFNWLAAYTVSIKEEQVVTLDDIVLLPMNLDTRKFDAHLFPNPSDARSEVNVLVNQLNKSTLILKVYEMRGNLIKTLNDGQKSKGIYTFTWDLRSDDGEYLQRGVYLLMYSDGTQVKTKKIFVK